MNCERMENRLIAYLDGKASAADRREVEAHLAACGACRTRAEEFRALWSVLDEAPPAQPSPAFDARLRARVAAEPARASVWAWLAPSPRLALAVTLLAVFSVWLSSLPPTTTPVQTQQAAAPAEAEFRMIRDLPVLEDYDVLANFEPLTELPAKPAALNREM